MSIAIIMKLLLTWIIFYGPFPQTGALLLIYCDCCMYHGCPGGVPTKANRVAESASINRANSIPQMSLVGKKSWRRAWKMKCALSICVLQWYMDVLTLVVIPSISTHAVGRTPSAVVQIKIIHLPTHLCVCACVRLLALHLEDTLCTV